MSNMYLIRQFNFTKNYINGILKDEKKTQKVLLELVELFKQNNKIITGEILISYSSNINTECNKLFDWNKDNENLLNDANIILENIKVLVDSDGKIYEKKV